jgi:RHS repeat-associated protein
LKSAPLVLFVAWVVSAQVIQTLPESETVGAPSGGRPSFDDDVRLASHRTVTPSGAEAAYPLNPMLDSQFDDKGSVPNADFEATGGTVGSPPSNSDLEAAATITLTVPNGDFETGTFQDWTTAGSPTIDSDGTHGSFALLDTSTAEITSDELELPSDVQTLAYDVGYLRVSGQSWVDVYVLSGSGFTTSTKVKEDKCNNCNYWSRSYVDLSSYAGQTIKVKFKIKGSLYKPVGIDGVTVEVPFPDHVLTGAKVARRQTGADDWAELTDGTLTSSAFEVDEAANYLTFELKGSGRAQIFAAEGPSFTTWGEIGNELVTSDWATYEVEVGDLAGAEIKLRVKDFTGSAISVDDVGLQTVELPGWTIEGNDASLEVDSGNHYASVGSGSITSSAFTVPTGAQNISIAMRSASGASLPTMYVHVLSGEGYATSDELDYDPDLPASWATRTYGIGAYEGQSVKIKVSQSTGSAIWVDDAGEMSSLVRGWDVLSDGPVSVDEDAGGTHVTSPDPDGEVRIRSAWVNAGVLNATGDLEARVYSLPYEFTRADLGVTIDVKWVEPDDDVIALGTETANTARVGTMRVLIRDTYSDRGRFRIDVSEGAKLYAVGDNAARQQLSEPFARRVGMGIDTSSGSVTFAETDASFGGTFPVSFTRYYNSHSDAAGSMGSRWTHTFDTRLAFIEEDVSVVLGSGREETFDRLVTGAYRPYDPRVYATLVKNGDGTYLYTTKDNLKYRFDAGGVLTSIEDLNGNDVTLSYDGSDRLDEIAAPGGSFTLAYDANDRIETVTDPLGAVTSYGYDADGDLVSVIDAEEGVRTYTYVNHLLDTVTDQAENLVFDNDYDDLQRITSQTDSEDESFLLSYEDPGKGATLVTDPNGDTATFYFDRFQRTTDVVDATDRIESYIFDSVGNLDKIIDPADAEWDFGYNATGDLTSSLDPLANPSSITWDAKHLPTSVTDSRGKVTTMTYDGTGNLLTVTDPLENTTTYTYDAAGHVLTVTDPLENTTTYTYDAAGNRTSMTNALDETWTYTYDLAGRLKTETDPLENVTTYAYDLLGRLNEVEDPLDRTTSFLWDPVGHLLRVTNPEAEQTNWHYDDRGLVEVKVDAAGNETLYGYDGDRRMTSITDPLGRVTTYEYDDAGRLVTISDPLENETTYTYDDAGRLATTTDSLERTTTYTYDGAGRLASTTLPNGGTTDYGRDGDGRLTSVTDPLDSVTSHTYDDAGRLSSTVDPLDQETSFVYDDAGRLTSQTDPLGHATSFVYDAAGRQLEVADALDNATEYGYDDAGQLVSVTDATDRTTTYDYDAAGQLVSVVDNAEHETVNGYDLAGRLTSVELPSGAITTYGYDERGLLVSEIDPLLRETTYAYDDAGQQTAMTDPRGNTTAYDYDDVGRLETVTDELDGAVELGYDATGQLTSMTDALGSTWSYGYDALGNRDEVTDPLERVVSWEFDLAGRLVERVDARDITTMYGYDDSGRQTSATYPGGSASFSYDDAGRRTSMTDATGTTNWAYDDADRITSVQAPGGSIGYGYDLAGRRASMSLPGDRTIAYTYNTAGQLGSITDPSDRIVTFGYDVDGNRTSISRPGDVISTYAYDDAAQVTSITHADGATPLLSFDYTYDDAGNRTSVVSSSGTESYTYDALNRLTEVSYPGGPSVSYTYDAAGNRASETHGAVTDDYTYDDAGQLTAVESTEYDYDENGNLVSAGADTFAWDHDNRLISASVGAHEASYAYDGDGVRTGAEVDEVETDLLVDRGFGLPTIVDDGTNAYLHAEGLVSEVSGTDATWALTDALGSVRGLTDGTGALTGTADWEAFGAPRTSTGEASAFGFTSEPIDPTGLVHLRARWLDPATGRFASADTVSPNAVGTQGYNLYAYAADNPATWTDPTGHFLEQQLATALLARPTAEAITKIMAGEAGCQATIGQTTWNGKAACVDAAGVALSTTLFNAAAYVLGLTFACSSSPGCLALVIELMGLMTTQGSTGTSNQLAGDPGDAPVELPAPPGVPPPTTGGGGASTDCDPPDGRLYRATRPDETAAIEKSLAYEPAWTEGKYFFPTQDQALEFALRMPDGPYSLTSGVPTQQVL